MHINLIDKFAPMDVNHYEEFERLFESVELQIKDMPLSGKTTDGLDIIINAYHEPEYREISYLDSDVVYTRSVIQKNGWIETTYYHPDGTVETMYDK